MKTSEVPITIAAMAPGMEVSEADACNVMRRTWGQFVAGA